MAIVGRKPKPADQRRNRSQAAVDWTDVEAVPFVGGPALTGRSISAATKRWWSVISSMPHCVLWDESDWQFALDTARIHAAFSRGDLVRAAELRIREKQMGTTFDARRDLRIRYVEAALPEDEAGVTALDEYRRMMVE